MSDRVILAVKFTPAGAPGQVRKAVGGFLRYVQHRDLHPTRAEARQRPQVAGLVKYVAYRDRASTRAELFGPEGTLTSEDRKAFASFVANALDKSSPQLFRGRDGNLHDRRRAAYRLVISPERASGLDLRRLTVAAVGRLERESGIDRLRWIAAIHRNTAHHHVHLVIAGMHVDGSGAHRRVDVTRQRLAAMKEELAREIEHQRAERVPANSMSPAAVDEEAVATGLVRTTETLHRLWLPRLARVARASRGQRPLAQHRSLIALRALARRYRDQVEHEAREEARRRGWEMAA